MALIVGGAASADGQVSLQQGAQAGVSVTPSGKLPATWQLLPVPGITTGAHPVPEEFGVPSGTLLTFAKKAPAGVTVLWSGAEPIHSEGQVSFAQCLLDGEADHRIQVMLVSASGEETSGGECVVRSLDLHQEGMQVTPPRLSVDGPEMDPQATNAETMSWYFGDSIAALTQLGQGRWLTSVKKPVTLDVGVVPAPLSGLVEWRLDGQARSLGTSWTASFKRPGIYEVSVGPPDFPHVVELVVYRTRIVDQQPPSTIEAGIPFTFVAETDPPGYEPHITWCSSTKDGVATPAVGAGPEFTVTFLHAAPTGGEWLGVKADNAKLGQDSYTSCSLPLSCVDVLFSGLVPTCFTGLKSYDFLITNLKNPNSESCQITVSLWDDDILFNDQLASKMYTIPAGWDGPWMGSLSLQCTSPNQPCGFVGPVFSCSGELGADLFWEVTSQGGLLCETRFTNHKDIECFTPGCTP